MRIWEWSVDVCLQQLQAFFNIMLKKFGVQGVKVQEIVSLDDEILAFLPYARRRVSSSLCNSIKDLIY